MEKTIKYLENGEYHYATVRSVGDLAQLKTTSKETLVEAINELWNGGGNADPSKAPKPEGYDQLVQDVADAVKNQQEISQQWIEWQNEEAQLTEERKQAHLQAMKEMQEAIDKAKADAAALDDKTAKLDEQITKTFSDLDTNIQSMHEQLQKEADRMNQELINTKSDLTKVRTDLQNAQLDNGKIHDELTNINGKFEHKVWQTDLDPLKEQIDRAETSVQQTKDELLGKASRQDLDTVSNTVSKLDTQLKETAKGVEISVKKDELGGEIAEALTNKTNILLGTRRFTTNKWTQRDHVEICSDPWRGFLVAKQNSPIEGIQQAYDVKAGATYTFSLFAKMDTLDNSNKPQITLAQNNLDTSLDTKIDVWRKGIDDITTDFKRYDLTFTPSEDCTIYPHVISNSNNPIFVCGYQLEIGKEPTPWEPNQEDVGDYVEKSEAQFNVYNDKIQSLTEKQRQQGDTQEKLRTEVTQTAEGVKQVSESLKDTNGDITKLRGDLERTADHMKSDYESYTNKAVGQISDSTLNLIRNSSFQNKDEDFAQWQNISAKANVRQDENGLRWVELTQSGLTTDNPQGLTSNYFNVKQGKVTVAVDIKAGDRATLDNESVLFLELYNDAKKRVDFRFVTLSELGLSKNLLDDHKVHRGLYRLGIDRNDAQYMTVKAHLMRNGDLYFTNFSARLSSIDNGAYEPNPDDINQQILKQNTKIEQNAKEVAIKANSVDVTRDIKSAVDGIQVGGTNLIKNSGTDIVIESKTTDAWPAWKYKVVYYDLTPGETYTFSVSATNTNSVKDASIRIFNEAQNKEAPGSLVFPADGKRHSTTFTTPKDGVNYSVYLYAGCMGNIEGKDFVTTYHQPQLELGNKSTSWSPAPEDTSAEIKSAKDAAIQVASDQVNIRVNELTTSFDDKLSKRVNEVKTASEKFTSDGIEQTVTKITNVKNDVDRLGDSVSGANGGDNLLKGTSIDEYKGKSYAFKDYQISGELQPNTTYTLSGWARVDQESLNHHQNVFIDAYSEDWSWSVSLGINASIDWQYNKITFTTPAGKQLHPYVTVYLSHPDGGTNENNNDAASGWSWIKKIKLEKGTNATSWTPHESEQVTKSRASGGGVNLLKLSSFRNTTIDELKNAWYVNPDAWINQNNSIVLDNKPGKHSVMDLTQTVKLEPDTDYVLSLHLIFAMTNPGQNWGAQTYIVEQDANGNNVNPYKDNGAFMVNGDQRSQNTRIIHTSSNTHQGIVFLRALPGTQVEFNEVKLEKGQIGTPWSNAPDDVSTMKQEVTASVKNLGDRVTTQVNSVTSKVDGIQIGGRNLAIGTDKDIVIDDTNNKGTQGWQFVIIHLAEQPKLGDQITISAEGVLTGNGHLDDYTVILYNETTTDARSVQGRLKPGQRSSVTVKVDNINGVGNTVLLIYAGNPSDTQGKKNVIHHLKIEKGNKPTEWSLAPEDTIEAIKEVNTKWDVANGQIQGKVTATDVNNILNGKGYATQSWAQTMFQMKSDSITLQAVRDNITNGIQNQVNSIDQKLNNTKVGSKNLFEGTNRGTFGWWTGQHTGNTNSGQMPINGENGVRFTHGQKPGGWWVVQYPFNIHKLKPNTKYTISFDIRTSQDRNENVFVGIAEGDSSGSPFVESPYIRIQTKANQVTHVTQTLTTKDNIPMQSQAFYFNSWSIGQCDWVDFVNLMMVEGTQSSEWSPAPEDIGNGVNVLRGTADFSWPTGIGTNNVVNLGYEKFDATTIQLHIWGKDSGIYTKWGGAFPDGEIQVGEAYTFSFDIKGSGTFSNVKNESESGSPANGIKVSGNWQRVSVSGTINSLGKAFIIYFQGNYDVRIKNVKIERGSKATPWTPHPFDDKDKGVNLLKSTAYWNPSQWNHLSDNVWTDDKWIDSLGNPARRHSGGAWDGLGQTVYVTPGAYTWSAQIYLSDIHDGQNAQAYYGDSQYNGTVQTQQLSQPIYGKNDQNKWINYVTTFYVKNAGNLCVRPELSGNGTIHVGSQKLEHGMVATSWTPSPYDDKNATITLNSADINNMKTQGHYFVRNLANSPIAGWVYVDVTGNNNDRLKQEVYQDNGYEHRSRRWTGSGWTEWTTDVNNKNVVSQINITPDQIKIASNKIVIDGNTDIHGDLRTDRVRLVGKNGAIDMTGDTGIKLTNNDGSSMLLGRGNIDLTYKNDFRMNIDSSLMTIMQRNQFTTQKNPIAILNIGSSWNHSNNQIRGADIRYNPGNVNDVNLHGADYLALSYNKPNLMPGEANIKPQLVMAYQDLKFDENHYLWRKGVNVADDLTIQEYQRINVGYRDKEDQSGKWTNDPLMIHRMQWGASSQADRYQPTIRLGYSKDSMGSAGVTFLWNQVKPFGNRDISDLGEIWFNGQRFVFGWASHERMFGNQQQPAFMRLDDKGGIMSGIAFTPGSTWDLGSGAWNITASVMNHGG